MVLFICKKYVFLSTAIAHSIAFFSFDPRIVLVMGYMAEFRFHNPIFNSATLFTFDIDTKFAFIINVRGKKQSRFMRVLEKLICNEI